MKLSQSSDGNIGKEKIASPNIFLERGALIRAGLLRHHFLEQGFFGKVRGIRICTKSGKVIVWSGIVE